MRAEYENIILKKRMYDQQLQSKTARLERAKLSNAQLETLISERRELVDLLSTVIEYKDDLKKLFEAINNEDREFKNRRISFINGLITEALDKIFPDDKYRAELICDFYRKSEANLVLLDKHGNEMIPDICSGKLQQYLISFAAVSGISKGLGVNNLFVDEAFGVAAPEILGDIGKIIQQRVEEGMQVIMIAQNPAVYQDIPHRKIAIRKNPATQSVELTSVTDY